jgi:hypothetical protein
MSVGGRDYCEVYGTDKRLPVLARLAAQTEASRKDMATFRLLRQAGRSIGAEMVE